MALGSGDACTPMAEAKWEDPGSDIKDPHNNRSAKDGPKCTRKK